MNRAVIKIALSFIVLFSLDVYLLRAQESPFPSPEERTRLKTGEHVLKPGKFASHKADFGIILVPENRNNPDSKTIDLAFIRIHALEDRSSEPLFLLKAVRAKATSEGYFHLFFSHITTWSLWAIAVSIPLSS